MRPNEEWRREAVAWLLAAGLLYLVYLVFRPFLTAMLWAGVLGVFFCPGHRWLLSRLNRPRLTALLSTLAVATLLAAPLVRIAQSRAMARWRERSGSRGTARRRSNSPW